MDDDADLLYWHPMIAHLKGTVHRQLPGKVTMDVHGVGYAVTVPLSVWEKLEDGAETILRISPYIREDRFDLFGFLEEAGKTLFEKLTSLPGIGPHLAMEICSVPGELLMRAIGDNDSNALTSIKGVGKKRAEKLLLELRSVAEKMSGIFSDANGGTPSASHDSDAVEALRALGYDSATIIRALRTINPDLRSTEERVTAALRSL